MAQNVGTPRFYVDTISWLQSIGVMTSTWSGLNPTDIQERTWASDAHGINFYSMDWQGTKIPKWAKLNYWATLGHNLKGVHHIPHFHKDEDSVDGWAQCQPYHREIINAGGATGSSAWFKPEYDGFTITEMVGGNGFSPLGNDEDLRLITLWSNDDTGLDNSDINLPFTGRVGAVSVGEFYDMPHSPDLNLKLTYEYDGVKTIQTKGGATLSNATYTKPADWGDGGAWQLGSDESGNPISNLRSGRRVWDLSFSYLSDTDLMPVVAATTNLGAGYVEGTPTNENTLLDGTDFFSQVINKTMGGHLPFIFQADKSNNSPDQFAIARFDMNSFSYDQVANNVYNVKIKVREVW